MFYCLCSSYEGTLSSYHKLSIWVDVGNNIVYVMCPRITQNWLEIRIQLLNTYVNLHTSSQVSKPLFPTYKTGQ